MGGYKKFTAKVKSINGAMIRLEHEEKMQVRPIEKDGYVVEIKTATDKVMLLDYEVKELIIYLISIAMK